MLVGGLRYERIECGAGSGQPKERTEQSVIDGVPIDDDDDDYLGRLYSLRCGAQLEGATRARLPGALPSQTMKVS